MKFIKCLFIYFRSPKFIATSSFALLTFIFLNPQAHAQSRIGNGGGGVACKTADAITSVQTLDDYEAETLFGWKLQSNPLATASYQDEINFTLDQLAKLAPARATIYRLKAAMFEKQVLFLPNSNLQKTDDVFLLALPKNCEYVQLAIHLGTGKTVPQDYLIDQSMWNLMTPKQKAGLVLHEIIYADFLNDPSTDSRRARYFNAVISTEKIKDYTPTQFVQLVDKIFAGTQFEALEFFGSRMTKMNHIFATKIWQDNPKFKQTGLTEKTLTSWSYYCAPHTSSVAASRSHLVSPYGVLASLEWQAEKDNFYVLTQTFPLENWFGFERAVWPCMALDEKGNIKMLSGIGSLEIKNKKVDLKFNPISPIRYHAQDLIFGGTVFLDDQGELLFANPDSVVTNL